LDRVLGFHFEVQLLRNALFYVGHQEIVVEVFEQQLPRVEAELGQE
jgi:hypothetical protein